MACVILKIFVVVIVISFFIYRLTDLLVDQNGVIGKDWSQKRKRKVF